MLARNVHARISKVTPSLPVAIALTSILAPLRAAVNASLCVRVIRNSLYASLLRSPGHQGTAYSTPLRHSSFSLAIIMQALGRFANLEAPSQVRSLAGQEEQSGVLPEVSIAGNRSPRISECSVSELWPVPFVHEPLHTLMPLLWSRGTALEQLDALGRAGLTACRMGVQALTI